MNKGRRIHDGIVGAVIVIGLLLAHFAGPVWLWLPAVLGIVLIQSAFTGFCPVYFILDRCVDGKSGCCSKSSCD